MFAQLWEAYKMIIHGEAASFSIIYEFWLLANSGAAHISPDRLRSSSRRTNLSKPLRITSGGDETSTIVSKLHPQPSAGQEYPRNEDRGRKAWRWLSFSIRAKLLDLPRSGNILRPLDVNIPPHSDELSSEHDETSNAFAFRRLFVAMLGSLRGSHPDRPARRLPRQYR